MSRMLTAKDIQSLLDVDRSTVYRMAEDGRLPAIKVGRQWRFPAENIEGWLNTQNIPFSLTTAASPLSSVEATAVADQFPQECVQMMQDTFAEALGVMLIITDMSGKPLTEFSNSCGLFAAIGDNDVLWEKCMNHWQAMADSLSLEPQYLESYLGLLCARAYIRVGTELKGMVFVGGIAPENWPPPAENLEAIAADLAIDPPRLFDHVQEIYFLSPEQQAHVLRLVQKIANVVSHILHERSRLMV
ncbi:PocR ligand-binding domain-containing protein [Candidatus Leptofilum sp.]|uniref:PocR ligand-binding domain-containing protein n=1 Tax=Candidatus Leptofilum sp. TaxID=3241576 RepID=UPI003B59AF71